MVSADLRKMHIGKRTCAVLIFKIFDSKSIPILPTSRSTLTKYPGEGKRLPGKYTGNNSLQSKPVAFISYFVTVDTIQKLIGVVLTGVLGLGFTNKIATLDVKLNLNLFKIKNNI